MSVEIKIELATPTDAARDPLHPDHGRWVKEQMLARETAWLRSLGVQVRSRTVDASIERGLQRLAARKRESRKVAVQRDVTTMRTAEKLAERAGARLIRRPLRQAPKAPPYLCKRCGTCIRCRREARALRIIELGRAGDMRMRTLALEIVRVGLRSHAKIAEFEHLSPRDANRAITRVVEDVCDRSVSMMGEWRR